MGRVLNEATAVRGPKGVVVLREGTEVPEWAEDLVGDHLFDAEDDFPEPAGPTEPPRAGRGSGVEAWTEYAEGLDIEVPEGASRDDVIALVDASKQD